MTISKLTAPMTRRSVLQTSTGLAGILATGRAPVFAQAAPKKLLWAHIVPPPESAAVACEWMTKELNERAKGALAIEFHGGTLIPKELEIMNAVKTGNIAIGGPAGAAATGSTRSSRKSTSSRSCSSTTTAFVTSGPTRAQSSSPRIFAGARSAYSLLRCLLIR